MVDQLTDLDFLTALTILISIFFCLLTSILFLRYKSLKKEKNDLFDLLSTTPINSCFWKYDKEFDDLSEVSLLYISPNLQGLLNNELFSLDHISLKNLIHLFPLKEEREIEEKIKNLHLEGSIFFHESILFDGQAIRMQGTSYQNYRSLVIDNISEEKNKEKHLLSMYEEVKASYNFFKEIIQALPIAVWRRDNEAKIIYCNTAYASALETNPRDVLDNSKELISTGRKDSAYYLALKGLGSQENQYARTHAVLEGGRKWLELCEIPIGDEGTIGYALDLSEIENLEKELEGHIKTHQNILEYISTPISVYGSDHCLKFFNKAYVKLFDFDENWLFTRPSASEIIENLRIRRKIPEYDNFLNFKKQRLNLFHTLLQPIEEVLHLPHGQILRVMIAPYAIGGLIFLYEDVTDKLALERRHNILIAVQKETLDHLYEGIAVYGSDYRLRLCNPAMVKLWGYENAERLVDQHIFDFLKDNENQLGTKENYEEVKQQITYLFSSRQARIGHFVKTDSSIIEYNYVPLPDGSHLLSLVDVSDTWRFERALTDRNKALEQSERVRTEFLTHISYELRAPLNSIVGYTEILLNQYFGQLNERQLDYCHGVYEAAQRSMMLVNDVHDITDIEAKQITLSTTIVDLGKLLSSMVSLVYNRVHDQGLDFLCENETHIEQFMADERRLKQALFHLLNNAIKYTPSGKKITLRIKLEENKKKKELLFSVEDSGVGLSPEKQEFILKFLSGSNEDDLTQKTTGLGLPLVKKLIELQKGRFQIMNNDMGGCTATISIPYILSEEYFIENQEEPDKQKKEKKVKRSQSKRRRVLPNHVGSI